MEISGIKTGPADLFSVTNFQILILQFIGNYIKRGERGALFRGPEGAEAALIRGGVKNEGGGGDEDDG